jgi:hypothetical protein
MWPIAIIGHLQPGWEDIDVIAARFGRLFEELAEVDPMFGCWLRLGRRHRSAVPKLVTLPPKHPELRSWIDEGATFGSRDGRKKTIGYALRAMTTGRHPVRADLWLSFEPEDSWFAHRIGVTIFSSASSPSPFDDPANQHVMIALLRRVLLAVGTAWACDWAGILPGNYRERGGPPGPVLVKYQSGWMIYLDATCAARIIPPQDVGVERLADGAMLFTAATNTKFNGENPDHWAAALRIQGALEPLNAGNEYPSVVL